MTARLSESELREWVPVPFDEITDPLATPEPSLGALVQLDSGGYVVLYYGEDSNELTLEIPENAKNSSALVKAFFREVRLPTSRVLWHREGITLPKKRSAAKITQTRSMESRLEHVISESVISCEAAVNFVVMKTPPAAASSVASAIDSAGLDDVLGTIAGGDTVFVAFRHAESAAAFARRVDAIRRLEEHKLA